MILADMARVDNGKLYVLGGGWNVASASAPSAIGILIEVPWAQTGTKHRLELELLTGDGQDAVDPDGQPMVHFDTEFEAVRPPGVLLGVPASGCLAFNFPPLPLQPGTRYRWQLSIDGQTNPDWEVGFSTIAAAVRIASCPAPEI